MWNRWLLCDIEDYFASWRFVSAAIVQFKEHRNKNNDDSKFHSMMMLMPDVHIHLILKISHESNNFSRLIYMLHLPIVFWFVVHASMKIKQEDDEKFCMINDVKSEDELMRKLTVNISHFFAFFNAFLCLSSLPPKQK